MVRIILGFAALLITLASAWPAAAEFLAVDRCLDAGGSFDYLAGVCDFKAHHASFGLWDRHGISLLIAVAFGVAGGLLLLSHKTDEQATLPE